MLPTGFYFSGSLMQSCLHQRFFRPPFLRWLKKLCPTRPTTKPHNIGESHYHKENKTNGGKQIEFSAESNQFEKKIKKWE